MMLSDKVEYFNNTEVFKGKRWQLELDSDDNVWLRDTEGLELSLLMNNLLTAVETCKVLNNYQSDKERLLYKFDCSECGFLIDRNYCSIKLCRLDGLDNVCRHFKVIG